jgi:biotin/methionine sulfoxide reductase
MQRIPHAAHWGAFTVLVENGAIVGIEPFAADPAPSPLIQAVRGWLDPSVRIAEPMVREGWLRDRASPGQRSQRGRDRFVPVTWDAAARLIAGEIDRVRTAHGNDSIFAGSYGWGSAGRFHHAQSQVRRLMNCVGGYTGHVETYSVGAGAVIMRHVLGDDASYYGRASGLDTCAAHSEILLVFGGLAPRTAQIEAGGIARHLLEDHLRAIIARGIRVVLVSPRRDDLPSWVGAEWWPVAPNTDTALLLGLAGEIVAAGGHDADFLARCCSGADTFLAYLKGDTDGTPKTAEWAAVITDIPAPMIRALAAQLTEKRTLITMSWSLQRAVHGEQPWWSAVALASVAGQIGKPGGGVTFGAASVGGMGMPQALIKPPVMPQGTKPNAGFIPVARIADMLLHPGAPFTYQAGVHHYPDVRLVYWAGGNPFHHHQDLARLERAWAKPETIVVQEIVWTPTAKRADIVLPACSSLERNDLAGNRRSDHVLAMRQAVAPLGQSRGDYDIMRHIADVLGVEAKFSEGRDEMAWIRHLYEETREDARRRLDFEMPSFETFWETGAAAVPTRGHVVHLADFRADPEAHRLNTESGRIVLTSRTLATAALPDCPPHPSWIDKDEGLRSAKTHRFQFHLVTAQPKGRLHSQLDWAEVSQSLKTAGRETVLMNPTDAARLDLGDGDTALLSNDRGRCLAGVRVLGDIRPGVAVLPTGAWLAPFETADGVLDIAGNPNVLTNDVPSSGFSQGCSAHTCLVAITRYEGNAPLPDHRVNAATLSGL